MTFLSINPQSDRLIYFYSERIIEIGAAERTVVLFSFGIGADGE